MTERYTKSVAAVMTSEPENSSPYGTRNKRRKLNEIVTPHTILQHPQSFQHTPSHQRSQQSSQNQYIGRSPMFSRNLDKALKSILSENPKLRNSQAGGNTVTSIEVTPSVEDESSSAAVPEPVNGRTPSASLSSESREETPSSYTEGIVETPAFITRYEKERDTGKISTQMRDEARELLREWGLQWQAEDKKVRQLKRKIKSQNAVNGDRHPVEAKSRGRSRGRSKRSVSRAPAVVIQETVESPKRIENDENEPGPLSESRSRSLGRRDSLTGTGPNGLTGSYWDIPSDGMGRGSRRKSKA
jgi:hypothetical protein